MMDYQELLTREINATTTQYWKTIDIWLNNPHLVNRRISSSVTILKGELIDSVENFLSEIMNISGDKLSMIPELSTLITPLKNSIDLFEEAEGLFVLVRKLLPRDENNFSPTVEFSIVDKSKMSVICVTRSLNTDKRCVGFPWPFKIIFDNKTIKILIKKNCEFEVSWLIEKLFPRLIKWMESDHNKNSIVEGSLNLVSPEKYTNLYNSLKKKYGTELVDKWPECTDPAKFVYEDIAIATYLILLWEEERQRAGIEKRQSFLDLGCGNGLLVYILMSEGHEGMGIDLRRRKIWDLFAEARLEERTIIPSSKSLFPTTDWLIGNHSDELTPWIPVIAARSSYKCRFFLLPCCAHEFDGRKFQRDSASSSQYSEYLKFIKTVCESCGFITELDKLRIPSTKRICLIGLKRNYSEDQTEAQDEKIEELINARSLKPKNNEEKHSDEWSHDFKPRDAVERVRNCTQIDRNVINEIVNLVTTELLRKNRKITLINSDKNWNAGGQIELNEIATIIPAETLKKLKKECGGLQTLLRNNSDIFQVTNGAVQFRIPGTEKKSTKKSGKTKIKFKIKQCWFFDNHPDGCPLSDVNCSFKHEIKIVK